MPTIEEIYEKLKAARVSKTIALKPAAMLRTEIAGPDGSSSPFHLRYYQVQGIYHLLWMSRMLLGDGTGIGKCVTGETRLATQEGLRPIQDLAPLGDLEPGSFYEPRTPCWVHTGSRSAKVHRFYWDGVKPTTRVRTHHGYEVEGSLRHPLFVRDRTGKESFKRLADILPGDVVCIERRASLFSNVEPTIEFDASTIGPNAKNYSYPLAMTPELGRLLGYVLAEAWVGDRYHTQVSQHVAENPDSHAEIRALFKQVFGWEGNEESQDKDVLIGVTSVGIRSFLTTCGIGVEKSRAKQIPECIFRSTRASVQGFLQGLFEGEASIDPNNGNIEFTSASERVALDVQTLLLGFGVVSRRSEKYVKGYDHTYWRLTITGDDARLFQSEVGFTSERKRTVLWQSLPSTSNTNKDVIPFSAPMVRALKDKILVASRQACKNHNEPGWGLKKFGESFQSTLKHIIGEKRDATYRFLRQLLEVADTFGLKGTAEYEEVLGVVQKGFFYDSIFSLKMGAAPVMDIEVDDPDHCFVGNGFINHNTLQAIASLCYLWDGKDPGLKAIVVTPKSALRQWESEFDRFTTGVKTFVITGSFEQRTKVYEEWAAAPTAKGTGNVLLVNYALLVRDWDAGAHRPLLPNGNPDMKKPVVAGYLDGLTARVKSTGNLAVFYDEATAFKNASTKTWQVCRFLGDRCSRCYGLTATLLKNNLMEGFSIYQVIKPGVFTTKTKFLSDFCYTEMQPVRGGRKIPVVVGYKNLDKFRMSIDPFFLGRSKHEVSNELPKLVTRVILCEMSAIEDAKYKEALEGVVRLGDGEVKDYEETKALTQLIYCQQIVDSLTLLKFEEGQEVDVGTYGDEQINHVKKGAKEQALLDLITDELDGEKVIIYTRFEKLVGRLQKILQEEKIKSVRITGKEKDLQRRAAQQTFQDPKSDVRVIFITDAGSEAINLQAASAEIFYDSPWSWGNYVQLLGRPLRIGSVHDTVVAFHLVAERPRGKYKDGRTIDHHVLSLLDKKKGLVDKVLGESAVGALDFGQGGGSATRDLLRLMKGNR